MNKTAIKNFAIEARKKLIKDITYQMRLLGIDADGIKQKLPQSAGNTEFYDIGTREPYQVTGEAVRQRRALVRRIEQKAQEEDYTDAFNNVIEEVAYTWFNRLIAIRFMEVNDYLPGGLRVLSAESANKVEPELVTTPFDGDLEFTDEERVQIAEWQEYNTTDELFKMLFIKECNALNEYLPELFEKTKDYTELLLNISVTDPDGVVSHLVKDIPEEDFNVEMGGQVEIIGWLYQFYISKPKDKLINARKKYKKDDIPFVTQIFTSEWIVKFIVQNSVGRTWLEGRDNEVLRNKWEYYLKANYDDNESKAEFEYIFDHNKNISPEKLCIIDPCLGSGHILVYAFDILMDIYLSVGYDERDAAEQIIKKNLYGLDIDLRAYQLAYFSLFMKARHYNRRILKKKIDLNIACIEESNSFEKWDKIKEQFINIDEDDLNNEIWEIFDYLIDRFYNAKEYGSIINIEEKDYDSLLIYINELKEKYQGDLIFSSWINRAEPFIKKVIKQANILSKKYQVSVLNPPYLNSSYMNKSIKEYVSEYYQDEKNDLFAVFIKRATELTVKYGNIGMLTPYVWMFISSFEKLRKYLLNTRSISSLVQLEYNAFESACVPVCCFTIRNNKNDIPGEYIKLSTFKGIDAQEIKTLEAVNDKNCGYRYTQSSRNIKKINGYPIAFWLSNRIFEDFKKGKTLGEVSYPKQGLASANNNYFLKYWYEVNYETIKFDCKDINFTKNSKYKWYPHNKGGAFRKWYGNRDFVINWKNNGEELYNFKGAVIRNPTYYFKNMISYSDLTAGTFSIRYYGNGFTFDSTGPSIFNDQQYVSDAYLLALLNTNLINFMLQGVAPTFHYSNFAVVKRSINS